MESWYCDVIKATSYIGSRQYDDKKSDCCDCEQDDIKELYNLLKPIIDIVSAITKITNATIGIKKTVDGNKNIVLRGKLWIIKSFKINALKK